MTALPSKFRYKCSSCNELHEGLPDVTFGGPDGYDAMSEDERFERALIDDDFCIIDGTRYFIRCVAEAPINGFQESFAWGLWAEVEWRPFKKVWELYGLDQPVEPLTFAGKVANALKHYDDTLGLACEITLEDDGMRPHLRFTDLSHAVARQQAEGLDLDEAVRQARTVGALLVVG